LEEGVDGSAWLPVGDEACRRHDLSPAAQPDIFRAAVGEFPGPVAPNRISYTNPEISEYSRKPGARLEGDDPVLRVLEWLRYPLR
jgi:hypothetical protein